MLNGRGQSGWATATAAGFVLAGIFGGCDGTDEPHDQAALAAEAPAQKAAAAAKLTVAQDDQEIVSGTINDGASTLAFEGRALGDFKYDITFRLNGAVLTAMGDAQAGHASVDGYAASNGGDTQLDAVDRAAFAALERELDRRNFDQKGGTFIAQQTVRMSSLFAQYPSSVPLQREIMGENDRSITMLCGNFLTWTNATHDCDHGGDYGAGQWALASVGERWNQGPGGQLTHELFQDEPFWHNATASHKGGAYIAGSCLGHCGGSCPAGNQNLTVDCLNHDQCVSGNHDLLSFWCDDEATSAADDITSAPSCPNTGVDPPATVSWETANFPNQGVEKKPGARAICYALHIADFAWTQEQCDNAIVGSTGLSKIGQAIKIHSRIPGVSICYQVTVQGLGTQPVVCDGAIAGTVGQGRRMETIRIFTSPHTGTLTYQTHIDVAGWLAPVGDNVTTGQAGRSIQAMRMKLCAHDVCATGANLVSESCDDTCVAQVCANDSFCCNNSWDSICKSEVTSFCGRTCP